MAVKKTGLKYVIDVDGEEAGFAQFVQKDGARDFNHTVIDPAFRGRGLSKVLIKEALDDTRAAGLKIIATCPAVVKFVEENPEYQD